MSWLQLGYGVALTVVVGAVIALCAQWRERRDARAARRSRRVEPLIGSSRPM